ncbi:MAG: DsbA family protein [Parvularculales bacterium]
MSLIRRILAPVISARLTDSKRRDKRRAAEENRRRAAGEPHCIRYFHQVDDPYSHLAAQRLDNLKHTYTIELTPTLVTPPDEAAAPESEKLIAYSRKDAADIAPWYGLRYTDPCRQPNETQLNLAKRILAASIPEEFPASAVEVGEALWAGDEATLSTLAQKHGTASEEETVRAIEDGTKMRQSLGHYLSGTFHYGGEWYWGVDRLLYLEERLTALGVGLPGKPPVVPRPQPQAPEGCGTGQTLTFVPSLRSPYSAIATPPVLDMVQRLGVTLDLEPVLPMVMRGLPVPVSKQRYIMHDAKREADWANVPFGRICDPVGRPVERGFSLFLWAREQGRAEDYLRSFMNAVWARGVDAGSDRGLQRIVTDAGLDWKQAKAIVGNDDWREEIEQNRRRLFDLGLWGVPSFYLTSSGNEPLFSTWGQDRLWLVEAEIARRAGVELIRS